MKRIVAFLLWVLSWGIVLGFSSSITAQDLGGPVGTKENLDLPLDASANLEEEEEDAPEIVTFYGQQLEGDGIFYVVDRSSTMLDMGELPVAKREVLRNIDEFSPEVQFAIVFFDANVSKFPTNGLPAQATPAVKGSARRYVQSIPGGFGTCCQQGLAEGLRFANLATSKRRVLVYVGDGGGTCQGANEATYLRNTLVSISSQNYLRVVIHCIGVLNPGKIQEDFMKRLSSSNGGTYRRITR
jgi:hypothetical protein